MTQSAFSVRFDMDAPAGAPAWMLLRYEPSAGANPVATLAGVSRVRYGSARLALGVAHACLAALATLDERRS